MPFLNTTNQKIITFAGFLTAIAYLLFVLFQDGLSISLYMGINFITFLVFFAQLYLIKKGEKGNFTLILLFAILFRVILLFSSPSTSDDVYRYLWEGKLVLNGYNPFELAPDDPALDALHTDLLPSKVSYPGMTTIYPTVSQVVFALGYFISGENLLGLKLIYLFLDILTILVLYRLLKVRGDPVENVLIYAWMPLTIMEYFINMHIDVAGIFFLVLLIYFLEVNKERFSASAFGLGVMVKLYPLLLAPLIVKKIGFRKSIGYFLTAGIIIILLFIPFIPEKRSIAASFGTYMANWSFYGSVYPLLGVFFTNEVARITTLALLGIVIIIITIKSSDTISGIFYIALSHAIFATTLFPWYLGYLAVLQTFKGKLSVFWLLFAINLTNFTPLFKPWQEYPWVSFLIYIPFYLLLLVESGGESFLKIKKFVHYRNTI